MDGKEESRSYKDDDAGQHQRFKEKIVYKIIPVPYYYPVPVDAEWYHKNYERHFRPNEFANFPFVDTTVEHFVPPPPPGFPYPRYHHQHHPHHYVYEPSAKRPHSTSPPPPLRKDRDKHGTSPRRSRRHDEDSSDQYQSKENSDDCDANGEVPVSSKYADTRASSNNNKHENNDDDDDEARALRRRHKEQRTANDERDVKSELADENDTVVVNGNNLGDENRKVLQESNEMESIRDRKRYLMTFPYDQKKKLKLNGHAGAEQEAVKHAICVGKDGETLPIQEPGDVHYAVPPGHHPHVVPAGHKIVPPQSVPYVMVPVQNQPYIHTPSVIHQPIHPASFATTEQRIPSTEHSRSYTTAGKLSPEIRDLKKELDEHRGPNKDENTDANNVKYHPNGRRARTVFTRHQLMTLNNVFEKHHFVSGEKMSELSDELGLDRKIVKIWFQNKRQYSRKKGSLLEKEDDYMNMNFEYQDLEGYSSNNSTSAPTMTILNHGTNKTLEDMKKYEDNLYKVSVLSDDYKPEYTDVKPAPESLCEPENMYEIDGETAVPVQG